MGSASVQSSGFREGRHCADLNQTEYYDVFLLDQDFKIERPKRAYRHGLHLLTGHSSISKLRDAHRSDDQEVDYDPENPLANEIAVQAGEGRSKNPHSVNSDEGQASHASQHTFFIVNAQRRLKLVARNAVSYHSPASAYVCTADGD